MEDNTQIFIKNPNEIIRKIILRLYDNAREKSVLMEDIPDEIFYESIIEIKDMDYNLYKAITQVLYIDYYLYFNLTNEEYDVENFIEEIMNFYISSSEDAEEYKEIMNLTKEEREAEAEEDLRLKEELLNIDSFEDLERFLEENYDFYIDMAIATECGKVDLSQTYNDIQKLSDEDKKRIYKIAPQLMYECLAYSSPIVLSTIHKKLEDKYYNEKFIKNIQIMDVLGEMKEIDKLTYDKSILFYLKEFYKCKYYSNNFLGTLLSKPSKTIFDLLKNGNINEAFDLCDKDFFYLQEIIDSYTSTALCENKSFINDVEKHFSFKANNEIINLKFKKKEEN